MLLHQRAQRLTVDEGHDVVHHVIGFARIEQGKNVGMLQISSQLDFTEKSLTTNRVAAFTVEDFHRNSSVMLHILGGINGRHASATEDALDSVTLRE